QARGAHAMRSRGSEPTVFAFRPSSEHCLVPASPNGRAKCETGTSRLAPPHTFSQERPPSSMKYDPSKRVLAVAVTLHHVPEKHISCDVTETRIKVDTTACKQHPYLLEYVSLALFSASHSFCLRWLLVLTCNSVEYPRGIQVASDGVEAR